MQKTQRAENAGKGPRAAPRGLPLLLPPLVETGWGYLLQFTRGANPLACGLSAFATAPRPGGTEK